MKKLLMVTGFIFMIHVSSAVAGQKMSTQPEGPEQYTVEEIADFAKKVERSLAENRARVAIVSRVGRPPGDLPEGIHYTHIAFWVYSKIQTEDGRVLPGYHIYSLYQDSKDLDSSALVNDFPVDYFLGVHELKAGIVIPKPKVQKAILKVLLSDTAKKLHNPKYSVVASPFNDQYQNCTEYTLDIILSALYQTGNVNQLKVNAREYFTPQKVQLSPLKTLFGPIFVEDFTVRDHDGAIQTATFTTIRKFMEQYELTQTAYALSS